MRFRLGEFAKLQRLPGYADFGGADGHKEAKTDAPKLLNHGSLSAFQLSNSLLRALKCLEGSQSFVGQVSFVL